MKRKYILPGLLLIFAGLYFLVAALPGIVMPAGIFFIALGAALLISRLFARKRYGLTIAGFILLWLGVGRLMLDVLHIGGQYTLVSVPLSIALAFFMTHIFEYRRLGNWPIIPALILLGFAVTFFLMLTPGVNAVLQPYYGTILPLILIIVGICVLVRGGRRNKKSEEQPIFVEFDHKGEDIPAPETWAQPPVEPADQPAEQPATEEPVTVIPEVEASADAEPAAEAEAEILAEEAEPTAELPKEEKKDEPAAE